MPIIVGIIVVIIGLLFWGISIYNSLVFTRERIDDARLQILIQIKSRWDIVRILTDLIKEFSKDDAESLEKTIDEMIWIDKHSSIREIETLEDELSDILERLSVISEDYIKLKESKVFVDTIESIEKGSERLEYGKNKYNNKVARMNRKVGMFPANIISNIFDFEERDYLKNTNV